MTGPEGEITPGKSIVQWPEGPESCAKVTLNLLG